MARVAEQGLPVMVPATRHRTVPGTGKKTPGGAGSPGHTRDTLPTSPPPSKPPTPKPSSTPPARARAHAPCFVWDHVRCVYSERAVTVPSHRLSRLSCSRSRTGHAGYRVKRHRGAGTLGQAFRHGSHTEHTALSLQSVSYFTVPPRAHPSALGQNYNGQILDLQLE